MRSDIAASNFFDALGFGEIMASFVWMEPDDDSLFVEIVLAATAVVVGETSWLKSISSEIERICSFLALFFSGKL